MTLKKHADIFFKIKYWPVGQGLFSSGFLKRDNNIFTWVYDCGSSSGDKFLSGSIKKLSEEYLCKKEKHKPIDLVVLSHFDCDHISGVAELISKNGARRLMLPFLPLHQRLIVAIEEKVRPSSRLFQAFVDPVGFFSGLRKVPSEFIIVMPSVDGGAPSLEGDVGLDPDGFEIQIQGVSTDTSDEGDDPVFQHQGVRKIGKKGRIIVSVFWEFVPYNDAKMVRKMSQEFEDRARECANLFIKTQNLEEKRCILKKLRKIYDDEFGKNSRARNIISLSLYSGHLRDVRYGRMFSPHFSCGLKKGAVDPGRYGQIYTGDAYLETPERFQAFLEYFTQERIRRHAVFQVMHHGAEGNWHAGLAAKIAPVFSVFSSDPHYKFHHPHALVLRDFWPFGAVQVDKMGDFSVCGFLWW